MRYSEKGELSTRNNDVFGMDFHDFILKEQQSTPYELTSEFGLSVREVQKIKKHLNRS
ncbi:hypothetical protein [Metabacillus arenae]|uniref:RNA polymerase subunit sigma-70 n=1 Tax=Metabacillus arenae TaxID=2771434 RepID=A0A926RYJ4_9BACI|nr:hypothetical protein [Metabacillus arenae]MBD1381242.1 hypothetical protein [Metabacillus arenae]